jgi:SAM-dependent methyltransferase
MRRALRSSRVIIPHKLKFIHAIRKGTEFRLLDVGCGNSSPSTTKYWFPQCRYFGLDIQNYNNDVSDISSMERFFQVDLTRDTLVDLPDESFDVIVMAHVIEHLPNGLDVVSRLCQKLTKGGQLYVEFPSEKSLRLPSGIDCLNFYDDPSHVRLYRRSEVKEVIQRAGLSIRAEGTRRHLPNIAIVLPLSIPLQLYSLMRYRKLRGPYLWDLLGFAEFVFAARC